MTGKFNLRDTLRRLGPGLITGAADDDPSGIATYSQAGAQFGFSMLWTMVFTLPLMVAIQLVSARIGYVTGHGLVANIKARFPRPVLFAVVGLLLLANTLNLADDIAAMAEALRLLVGGSAHRAPALPGGHDVLLTVVAVFGTTISPYLFFWQAAQEVEDINASAGRPHSAPEVRHHLRRIKLDTLIGMTFSNLIAFFIILSSAVTLHAAGVHDIETSAQAAEALRPLAGELTFLLFSLGIIGTGLLAVPVLAGSAAYAVAEAAGWQGSLSLRLRKGQGRGFYGVIAAATLGGVVLCFTSMDPVKELFWSAVLNGVIAVPIMAIMMLLASRRDTMGEHVIGRRLRWRGWLATTVMTATVIAMLGTA